MKKTYKPILFSTAMVQAILAGRKTQTRRIIKKKYSNTDLEIKSDKYGERLVERQNDVPPPTQNPDGSTTMRITLFAEVKKKYNVGDILWVRESYGQDCFGAFWYEATDEMPGDILEWKPSRYMPKVAARIFQEVVSVRYERLHDISEADALAEGIDCFIDDEERLQCYCYPLKEKGLVRTIGGLASLCGSYISKGIFGIKEPAKFSFQTLWDSIYGKDVWNKANPWVWVYEFKKVEKPTLWPQ